MEYKPRGASSTKRIIDEYDVKEATVEKYDA
jgi:hypothetical protein